MNYWLFQGNPNKYCFKQAKEDGVLNCWGVTAHKNLIQTGDKLIIWLTSSSGGVAALGEIGDLNVTPQDDYCWKEGFLKKEIARYVVGIIFLTDLSLFLNPLKLSKEECKNLNLKVGQGFQNTNYRGTQETYDALFAKLMIS